MPLTFNDVHYNYDRKDPSFSDALKGVTFNIEKGDFIALVGKTGSGKSTLVQTLNALLLPTSGYTYIDGFYVTADKKLKKKLLAQESKEVKKSNKKLAHLRKKVGLVFQFPEYQLFSDSVIKDVMFGPKNFKMSEVEAKEVATQALKEVGLGPEYYEKSPFELSGGEKRRVAIAGIIASEPDIVVLDEPTVGLDANGKKEIMDLIEKFHKDGKSVIVVTHNMDVVLNYANKVAVLKDGKLLDLTTPKELFKKADLIDYSLEEPPLIKLLKTIKKMGFKGDLSSVSDISSLANAVAEVLK
jgi:energy-coupling factor transport system ATP-binding protein